jgi:alpha-L-fucosidase
VRAKGGHFGEDFAYSAKDIRYTMKGEKTLYAIALGWPEDGKIVARALAKLPDVTARIASVQLLGNAGELRWRQDASGLTVELPARKPCEHAIALKIAGDELRGFKPELVLPQGTTVEPDASGSYALRAEDAEIHGNQIQQENQGGQPNLGFWDNPADWVSWKVNFKEPGKFKVTASCSTLHADAVFVVEAAGRKMEGKAPVTGAWDKFSEIDVGTVEVTKSGVQTVSMRARDAQSWKAINLRWLKLTKG